MAKDTSKGLNKFIVNDILHLLQQKATLLHSKFLVETVYKEYSHEEIQAAVSTFKDHSRVKMRTKKTDPLPKQLNEIILKFEYEDIKNIPTFRLSKKEDAVKAHDPEEANNRQRASGADPSTPTDLLFMSAMDVMHNDDPTELVLWDIIKQLMLTLTLSIHMEVPGFEKMIPRSVAERRLYSKKCTLSQRLKKLTATELDRYDNTMNSLHQLVEALYIVYIPTPRDIIELEGNPKLGLLKEVIDHFLTLVTLLTDYTLPGVVPLRRLGSSAAARIIRQRRFSSAAYLLRPITAEAVYVSQARAASAERVMNAVLAQDKPITAGTLGKRLQNAVRLLQRLNPKDSQPSDSGETTTQQSAAYRDLVSFVSKEWAPQDNNSP